MKIFGLTGGIACGKSTVSRLWRKWGIPVVDADEVSHQVTARDTPGYIAIIEAFGLNVLDESGNLDRKALGRIVFADQQKRKLLNSIVHPRIAQRTEVLFNELRSTGAAIACYDAPLLFENHLEDDLRPVVLVVAPHEVQVERIIERNGLTRHDAEARIATQLPQAYKQQRADVIINNDEDLSMLMSRARLALDEVIKRTSVSV